MRCLVTGGAGFVGSHVVDALVARGDRVVVLDDLSTGSRENLAAHDEVTLVEGSTSDAALVARCLDGCDACIHLAAAVGVGRIMSRPLASLLDNTRGADNVLAEAARRGTAVLFASTSEVYGLREGGPLGEDDERVLGSPAVARWGYAIGKEFGEAAAIGYHREHGLPVTVARLFNVVGPRQSPHYGMVLPRFVRQALAGDDLTVYGDGSQARCFLHVADAVRGLLALLDTPAAAGRVFNVGSAEAVRIIELAELVRTRTGSASGIRLVPYAEAYGDGFVELALRRPDTTALRTVTGWAPRHTLADAVDDLVAARRGSTPAVTR